MHSSGSNSRSHPTENGWKNSRPFIGSSARMHLIPLANTAHHARALHQPFYIERKWTHAHGDRPCTQDRRARQQHRETQIRRNAPPWKLKTLKRKRHSPCSGTAPLSLLNSCTGPDIASDQFYTLKTGNDSNAKALRMLVFSWRQEQSPGTQEISDTKKSARSLI